ncbi:MAG: DUF535 family protein [Lonepinella koalarum]|nr:DUF535 family protein [Lonepinella koalarum]
MDTPFSFPSFKQMYPDEKRPLKLLREYLRYAWRKFYCYREYAALIDWLNQDRFWVTLFTELPIRQETVSYKFCDNRLNKSQRLQAVIRHFEVARLLFGDSFCRRLLLEKSVKLADLTEELSIYLNINNIDTTEGFFSINIRNQTKSSLYDASFTFLSEQALLIASIQGPKGEYAQDVVKNATKQLHGVRPMYMLVNVFRLLSAGLNCVLLGIPHKAQAKYRWNDSSKLLFNYDEFWQDNGGKLNAKGYWQLPLEIERKTLEDIASKKRSMYRKRYEMFDNMQQQFCLFKKV